MSYEAFVREMNKLPPLIADEAPWYLNKSGTSVDTGKLGKGCRIRQEGRRKEAEGNARLIAGAATNYNLVHEALYALARCYPTAPRPDDVEITMGLMCDVIAWIHDDPRGGQGLRLALGLPAESHEEHQRPEYGDKPPKKRVSKKRKRRSV